MMMIMINVTEFCSPPNGIELQPVTKSADIQKAFNVWPGANKTNVDCFERASKYRANCGAFLNDGTMVAWVFR